MLPISYCRHSERPTPSRNCNLQTCPPPANWTVGEWSTVLIYTHFNSCEPIRARNYSYIGMDLYLEIANLKLFSTLWDFKIEHPRRKCKQDS